MKKNTTKILIGVGLIGVAAYLYFKSKPTQKTFVRNFRNQDGLFTTLEEAELGAMNEGGKVRSCPCSDGVKKAGMEGFYDCCNPIYYSKNIKDSKKCDSCGSNRMESSFGYEFE